MDKVLKITIIIGIMIVVISMAYYLVIFLPQKEKMKIEQQNYEQELKIKQQEQENLLREGNLRKCLDEARDRAQERWDKNCDGQKKEKECSLPSQVAEWVTSIYNKATEDCFKLYPSK